MTDDYPHGNGLAIALLVAIGAAAGAAGFAVFDRSWIVGGVAGWITALVTSVVLVWRHTQPERDQT